MSDRIRLADLLLDVERYDLADFCIGGRFERAA